MAIGSAGAQLATDCTLYASPAGGSNGGSAGSPTTITGANNASGAGSVICLEGGTYNLGSTIVPNGGTAGAHIKWEPYGDSPVKINWTGTAASQQVFNTSSNHASYIDFVGPWEIDGNGYVKVGFLFNGGHHLSVSKMYIHDTSGSGISTVGTDYVTADHNVVWHCGYNPHGISNTGWTSAISYNSGTSVDGYTGFHNYITNNILAGEYDSSSYHTDGNNIILDLANNGTWPPTLIANNVGYGTGGRCIQTNTATQANVFTINNTCYDNGLDTSNSNVNEYNVAGNNAVTANNISVALRLNNYNIQGSPTGLRWFKDMWNGGAGINFSNPALIQLDPLFVNPPAESIGGYASTPDPGPGGSLLGNALALQSNSPAIAAGIDPTTIGGLNSDIVRDMRSVVSVDINGVPRVTGAWDLGAYQASLSSSTPPGAPTGLTATVR